MACENLSNYDRDKTQKQRLVLETVAAKCTDSSPHEDIRTIARALKDGRAKLHIDNLSGGYTNYSYKISLVPASDDATGDDIITALFVKLCFPRALWNPDPEHHYNVQRVENEAVLMKKFHQLAPGCVAIPYMVLDVDDMKILVTQWSSQANEQLANQFIDGVADVRVGKGLAAAIAALHCSKLDPDFNTEARECIISMFPTMKENLMASLESQTDDRVSILTKELGEEFCANLFDKIEANYRAQECLCHTDLHALNILVESKPDVSHLEIFGEKGVFGICDWEMAMYGPLGLDIGRFYSIPVACIFAHTIGGNNVIADGILEYLDIFWETYAAAMKKYGKTNEFLLSSYRNSMAWLGWSIYGIYVFEIFIPLLSIDAGGNGMLKESLALVGLKLMKWGFGNFEKDLSLKGLRCKLNETIREEIENIKKARHGIACRRRSSVLYETNRRVSDAFQEMGQIFIEEKC